MRETGAEMVEEEFERVVAVVDVAVLTMIDGKLMVALPRRPKAPFEGVRAMIGGYIHTEEDVDVDAAVARVLRDKAGIGPVYTEQVGTYSGRDRDTRGWTLSVVYLAVVPSEFLFAEGSLIVREDLVPADDVGVLAFDHGRIVASVLERVRGKGAYSSLPLNLLPQEFSWLELRIAYQAVTGEVIEQSSFRRKMNDLNDDGSGARVFFEPAGLRTGGQKRPTQVFRRTGRVLSFFDRRI
jgi:8-oxo-dGTP diphosphatase